MHLMKRSSLLTDTSCQVESRAKILKGETILSFNDHTGRCGILQSGEAHISCIDSQGQESILEILSVGDSFGEYYMSLPEDKYVRVVADTDCDIMFINVQKALVGCGRPCANHQELMRTLFLMSTKHSQIQMAHVSILAQRTLRDKLLAYFEYQASMTPNPDLFEIPMTFSALSDYLCVNRSAMMREIKKMNDDGLIQSQGRWVHLAE